MSDKETIINLQCRLNLLSNTMADMFLVVATHIPATNEQLGNIVKQWEQDENRFPLPEDKPNKT